MKIIFGIILFIVELGTHNVEAKIGTCADSWYYVEKSFCDSQFVKGMNSSDAPLKECPTLYTEAHKCFEKKILEECFGEDPLKHNKTIAFLEHEFGDEDHFCKFGLLATMKTVMMDVDLEDCDEEDFSDYEECEKPFRDAFQEEFNKKGADLIRLSKAFAATKICQSKIAISCKLLRTKDTIHFFDSEEFNPYDPEVIKRVSDAAKTIEHGGKVGTADATYITIAIVGVALLVALGAVFYFLWRRDRNRAEARRQKAAAKTAPQNNGQQQQEANVEMQPLASAAVVQTPDEVSSA